MRIVIIGAGFAGMYAALSAARLRDIQGVTPEALEIMLVSPEPTLVVRPRLYETRPETLTAPLQDVLKAIDVVYLQGSVVSVDTKSRALTVAVANQSERVVAYDRLVIAAGSRLFRPDIPGLEQYGFSVDQLSDAVVLDRHLHDLAKLPPSKNRDTVVVAGGGFTGIEVATELPARMRAILGRDTNPRIVIVERNAAIAPDMGTAVRPHIEDALQVLGVDTRTGVGVTSLDTSGRLLVDRELRVPSVNGVFATGDAAKALCDDKGTYALMSCQHATRMGAFAGNNAAAELLGVPTKPYHQEAYVTCLDLGAAGALFTRGWERKVEMVGDAAKKTKHEINTVWIYPPRADRAAALASADPEQVTKL
jgi:NADH dehydrogenase